MKFGISAILKACKAKKPTNTTDNYVNYFRNCVVLPEDFNMLMRMLDDGGGEWYTRILPVQKKMRKEFISVMGSIGVHVSAGEHYEITFRDLRDISDKIKSMTFDGEMKHFMAKFEKMVIHAIVHDSHILIVL